MSSRFYDIDPSLENYWRGVILFGRNVASYKFALAKSLLELADKKSDFIALEKKLSIAANLNGKPYEIIGTIHFHLNKAYDTFHRIKIPKPKTPGR